MKSRFLLIALLASFSLLGQNRMPFNDTIILNNDYRSNYDIKLHSAATTFKYVGFGISTIGLINLINANNNSVDQNQIESNAGVITTGLVISFISELIMDIQVLRLGKQNSKNDDRIKSGSEIDVDDNGNAEKIYASELEYVKKCNTNPDGIYSYRRNKEAKFVVRMQTGDKILIYFESENEMGEHLIDPNSDKLRWINNSIMEKYVVPKE